MADESKSNASQEQGQKGRTEIKDLPVDQKELSSDEAKKVQGGFRAASGVDNQLMSGGGEDQFNRMSDDSVDQFNRSGGSADQFNRAGGGIEEA